MRAGKVSDLVLPHISGVRLSARIITSLYKFSDETEKAVRGKEDRLKMWKQTGEDDDRNEYKRAKGAAKKVVARVKTEAIEELYANLETCEGQKDIQHSSSTGPSRKGYRTDANHQERNGRCID